MDTAVAVVNAYLHVNGYFTVAEYPVVQSLARRGYSTATDIDLLALRPPRAGGIVPVQRKRTAAVAGYVPDPALQAEPERADMLLAEVKEGRAEINRGGRDKRVLAAVLTRFGCCDEAASASAASDLLRRGRALLPSGLAVRLAAFGSTTGDANGHPYLRISLTHVIEFLEWHVREHWAVLRHTQIKDPAFALLALQEKARRAAKE